MKIRFIILALLVSAVSVFTGCIKDDLSSSDKTEMPIRILTTIEFGFGDNTAKTRNGTVEDVPDSYFEGEEAGTLEESIAHTVRVLAFDKGTGKLQINKMFVKPGMQLSDGQAHYKYVSGTGTNVTSASNIWMDMQIPIGTYRFVLIANEEAGWTNALNALAIDVAEYSNLQQAITDFPNTILSESDVISKGIPMLGEQDNMSVPFSATATATNPTLINPTIELKRTLSKAQLLLANSYENTAFQVTSVALHNSYRKYNLFESNTTSLTQPYFVSAEEGVNPTTFRTSDLFIGDLNYIDEFNYYMAERKEVTLNNATYLSINAKNIYTGVDIDYQVPLYQLISGSPDYSIKRNTLYRIRCLLVGNEAEFIQVHYLVSPWDVVEKSLFMGYGYTVEVIGNNITVSNTMAACSPHKIELKIPAAQSIIFKDDGSKSKIIDNVLTSGIIGTYELSGAPNAGVYLQVYYNDVLVKTYTK